MQSHPTGSAPYTPEKWVPVKFLEDRFQVLSPNKHFPSVYVWQRTTTLERYVGATEDLQVRVYHHLSSAKKYLGPIKAIQDLFETCVLIPIKEKLNGATNEQMKKDLLEKLTAMDRFHGDLALFPGEFQFGFCKLSPNTPPEKAEKKKLAYHKERGDPLYNVRGGGGGLRAKRKIDKDLEVKDEIPVGSPSKSSAIEQSQKRKKGEPFSPSGSYEESKISQDFSSQSPVRIKEANPELEERLASSSPAVLDCPIATILKLQT